MSEELRHELVSMTYRDEVVSCEMTREELISIEDELEKYEKEIERLNFDKEQLNSLVNSCQKEIRRLKEELKQAKEIALNDHKYASEMEDKYIIANNIINELEKSLIEEIEDYDKHINSKFITNIAREQYEGEKVCFEDMLGKLQELKGSDSNE